MSSRKPNSTRNVSTSLEVLEETPIDFIPRSKKSVEAQTGATRENIVLRCGDCMHFKGTPNPVYGEPCVLRGVKTFGVAPACFTPDTSGLKSLDPETFASMLSILSSLTPRQTRILMGMMKSAGKLEKFNLSFLEKVYFRTGEDYLQNYCSGRVLGVGVNSTIMVIGEPFLKSPRKPFVAALMNDSILNLDKFRSVRSRLVKAGLIYPPTYKAKKVVVDDDYEPPTIEMSQDQVQNMGANKKKRRPENSNTLQVNLES